MTGDFTVELWAWFDRDSESMFLQQQSGVGNGGFEFDYQPASVAQGRAVSNLVFAKDANQAAIYRVPGRLKSTVVSLGGNVARATPTGSLWTVWNLAAQK